MLVFPTNPSYGQIFIGARRTWVYRENFWDVLDDNSSGNVTSTKNSVTVGPISPVGLVDGTNKEYSLNESPISGSLQVYYNGLLQKRGESYDYLDSNRKVEFFDPPYIGSNITVIYEKLSSIEIMGEVPTLDNCHCEGSLPKYNLEYIPLEETIRLYLNGLLKKLGEDYTINDNQISFTYSFPPDHFTVQVYYKTDL